jgi:hypothetical protein
MPKKSSYLLRTVNRIIYYCSAALMVSALVLGLVFQPVQAHYSPTHTPTPYSSPTRTPTRTGTPTKSSTPTKTPSPTATLWVWPTHTFTPTMTSTSKPTDTFTPTATSTSLPTNTFTATATSTSLPTNTFTPSPTATSLPTDTFTPSPTATSRPTDTFTPSATTTSLPTDTFTATATTETPLPPTDTPTQTAVTDTPPTETPEGKTETPIPTDVTPFIPVTGQSPLVFIDPYCVVTGGALQWTVENPNSGNITVLYWTVDGGAHQPGFSAAPGSTPLTTTTPGTHTVTVVFGDSQSISDTSTVQVCPLPVPASNNGLLIPVTGADQTNSLSRGLFFGGIALGGLGLLLSVLRKFLSL